MKKYSTLLFFLLFINLGFSQNKEIDSLRLSLKNTSIADTTKINTINKISENYVSINLDSFKLYVNKSLRLSLKTRNHKLSRIYSNLSIVQMMLYSNNDSARYYLDEALKILDKKENLITRAAVYSNYSMSFADSGNYDIMTDFNLKAIELLQNNPSKLCVSHFNQAMLYSFVNFEDLTIKHLKLAVSSAKEGGNSMVEAIAQKGLARYDIEKGEYESAKLRLLKGLDLCEKHKLSNVCFEINIELGRLYDKLKNYESAHKAFLQANEYAIQYNNNYNIMSSIMNLGLHEFNKQNYYKSSQYFDEFNKMYIQNPKPQLGVEVFYSWSEAEGKIGNYKKSHELLKKYVVIIDSIFTEKNRIIIADAEAKHQSEKKDKAIVEQQLELSQNKTQLQKNKTQFSYMAGGVLLVVVSSILLWFLYQQRQKRKNQEILTLKREHQVQTLESLMEGEEKERFRIAKELHDGVNGDLSAIKFKLSSLLEMNNSVIKEAVTMIDKSCQQVRAISHNLVPPSLQDFNLVEALEEYCTNMNAIHSPKISFQQLGDAIVLTKKQEANIYRIVQELVNNSIKHAQADEIKVQISSREKTIQVTVEDNGKGYDKETIKADGIGLKNIESRVAYLNANLDLVSNEQGTSTTIEIDINKLN